jgi:hypothetical protein
MENWAELSRKWGLNHGLDQLLATTLYVEITYKIKHIECSVLLV